MASSSFHISIDGRDVPADEAKISIFDHGFLFGDSVYEVVRTWRGKLLFADEHFERLQRSAAGIALPLPLSTIEYKNEMRRLHQRSGNAESYIRLIVTRGTGELDLATASCKHQTSIMMVKPLTIWPEQLYREGGKLRLASVQRNSPRATNPAFKTGNYLNNVMAVDEARKVNATEALMLSASGRLTECTTSNIFFVKDGVVHTPELGVGILSGVTRAHVLDVCKNLKQEVRQGLYRIEEFESADEAFITSTTRDVMPITRLDERVIGSGKPGPITARLLVAYREHCEAAIGRS